MQYTHAVPTPLDALIARLDTMSARYEARQTQPATVTQETHEIAEAVAVALQDGAL